ncbi:hypothetical protein BVC80_9037g4 [Macleaya cordata]|uniref:Uncharacterized protein n=1 Tax=Macleaya cordata TaxID=56857 RepID=A0A200Q5I1_MACCD|nr:hypothetical protein BVC80_9037g4 [Macleaya cordata]
MQAREGEGRSEEMEFTVIDTAVETLEKSVIFHVVKEIIGFILYMHQQIPAILQDITLEFDTMQTECKDLESVLTQSEVKSSLRRKHNGRMREVKQGIKRLEKLMKAVSNIQTALQLMLNEVHGIEGVILVLGASPIRPQHVYEMSFFHGRVVAESTTDYTKSRMAEALSRKAIRALISSGAGSVSYAGQTKLFLLMKAPATLNMPLHFLPKRDFRYSKKIIPVRLRIKCKVQDQDMSVSHHASATSQSRSSISCPDSTSNDLIWFQCRHTIKGLPYKTPSQEE